MKERPKRRWFCKWAGGTASLMLVLVWGVSLRWEAIVVIPGYVVFVARGSVTAISENACIKPPVDFAILSRSWPLVIKWKPRWETGLLLAGRRSHWIDLPLWVPFLAVALPTGILWYRERRYPPGHCPACDYNLTGNVSGVCPECGTKIELLKPA